MSTFYIIHDYDSYLDVDNNIIYLATVLFIIVDICISYMSIDILLSVDSILFYMSPCINFNVDRYINWMSICIYLSVDSILYCMLSFINTNVDRYFFIRLEAKRCFVGLGLFFLFFAAGGGPPVCDHREPYNTRYF